MTDDRSMIEALLHERATQACAGDRERVAAVDAELAARGYDVAAQQRQAAAEPREQAPRRRGRPPKATA